MILDANLQLASAYSPTLVQENFPPYYLDTLAIADWGAGADWLWYIEVATAFAASGGASTMQLKLYGNKTDPTFASGNVTLLDTGALSKTVWVKGYEQKLKIPRSLPGATQSTNNYRYITLSATIATNAMTAGVLNSWITNDAMQDNRAYAAGYSIL